MNAILFGLLFLARANAGTSSTLEWKSDGLNSNQFIFSTGPPSTNVAAFAVDTTPSKDLVQLPPGSYVIESSEGQNDSNNMAVVFNLLDSHGDVLTKIWGPQEGWHGVGTWSTVYDGTASTEGTPTFTLWSPTWVRVGLSNSYTSYNTRCHFTISYTSLRLCNTTEDCKEATFGDQSSTACTAAYACRDATFEGTAVATCSASQACHDATFEGTAVATCSAYQACHGATFEGTEVATCSGTRACHSATFKGTAVATCSVRLACFRATFKGAAVATCSADHACYETTWLEDACCKGNTCPDDAPSCDTGSLEQSGVGDGDELNFGPIVGGACGAIFVFAMGGLCLRSYFKESKTKNNARILQQQQKLQREQEQEVIRLRKQEDAKLQQEKERLLEQEMNSIDDKFELPSFDHKIDLPSFDNGLYPPVAGLPNVPSNIPSLPPPATNTFYPPPAEFHMPPPPPLTGHVSGSDLPPGYASALIVSQNPSTIVIPAPAAPSEATLFCVHCGKGVRPGSMFCIGCGKRL